MTVIGLEWNWPRAGGGAGTTERPLSSILRPGENASMLKFTTEDVDGVLVVAFEATDEHATDWQFGQRDWLYKLVESHEDPRFAVDLSEVNYLASSEIGFLVTLKRRIDRRQGRVVFFGIGPYILEIFKTMNLVRILDIVDTLSAAMVKLGAPVAT
jgi:anti-sigma B factor antagonist